MVPCILEQPSLRDPFILRRQDDDILVNATLRYKLGQSGITIPEFSHDESLLDYLDSVDKVLVEKPGWSVELEMALSTFQFSKIAMWEDLEALRVQGVDHPLVRTLAMAGSSSTPSDTTSSVGWSPLGLDLGELAGGKLDDVLDMSSQFLIRDADFSQVLAVEAARGGENLVIHGPPGTGKSQTIANIIATLIADGKKVLFVSEKKAALDVVKRWLEECNLGVFCLDTHGSGGKNKGSIYDQLSDSVDDRRELLTSEPNSVELASVRSRLNRWVRLLHKVQDPLGRSAFELQAVFASLREIPDVPFSVADLGALDQATWDDYMIRAKAVANHPAEFAEHDTSVWRLLLDTEPKVTLADEIRRDMNELGTALEEVEVHAESLSGWFDGSTLLAVDDIVRVGRTANHLAAGTTVESHWLDGDVLQRISKLAKDQSDIAREFEQIAKSLDERLDDWRTLEIDVPQLATKITIVERNDAVLSGLLGPSWHARIVHENDTLREATHSLPSVSAAIRDRAEILASVLGTPETTSQSDLRRKLSDAQRLAQLLPVPPAWLKLDDSWRLKRHLHEAQDVLGELTDLESELFQKYDEAVLETATPEMLVRFRTDHTRFLRIFSSSYRSDRRALRGHRRASGDSSVASEALVVESAIEVIRLRSEWDDISKGLDDILGQRYEGRTTDFPAALRDVDEFSELARTAPPTTVYEQVASSLPGAQQFAQTVKELEHYLLKRAELEATFLGPGGTPDESAPIADLAERVADCDTALEAIHEILATVGGRSGDLAALRTFLDDLGSAQSFERHASQSFTDLSQDLGYRFRGWKTDWSDVQEAIEWTSELLHVWEAPLTNAVRERAVGTRDSDEMRRVAETCSAAEMAFESRIAVLRNRYDLGAVGLADWRSAEFMDLHELGERLSQGAHNAGGWLRYRQSAEELESLIGSGLLDEIRVAIHGDAELIPDVVQRRLCTSWLDSLYDREIGFSQFVAQGHDGSRERFADLDRAQQQWAKNEVRKVGFRSYPSSDDTVGNRGQLGILRRQLSRKRVRFSTRRLFSSIPDLLLALKPCLLMSPLAVSQYLARTELASETVKFDTVIFDEASQVFPEDAILAISRASQVIVVGDQKQLPPTNVFRKNFDDDEPDDDIEDSDALAGMESILDGMLGTNVQQSHLEVHYRSQHEDLIRFSNHHFYRDRLLLFPTPAPDAADLGLRDVYLPQARYDAGATRTNPDEAARVVDLVFEHLRTRPTESLGVVAFSSKQIDEIERRVELRRAQEPDVEQWFSSDLDYPIFFKNLENVQGDERDHIIVSVGYGPTKGSNEVPQRFGPQLMNAGGERRLNVVFSRAKKQMTVVHCLRPGQISEGSKNDGPRVLRRFLEYLQDPKRAFELEGSGKSLGDPESPFEESVLRALDQKGYRVAAQVGTSGYRIDLAIRSESGETYDLGIECDGWTYHSSPAARDRDWLRQGVLEGLGWTIHRLWSTAWTQDPEHELERIEAALNRARSKTAGRPLNVSTSISVGERKEADEGHQGSLGAVGADPKPGQNHAVSQSTESVQSRSFKIYELAPLSEFRRIGELKAESYRTLDPMIRRVAEVEGPVHFETLMIRLREAYGMGRAGEPTKDHVDAESIAFSTTRHWRLWRSQKRAHFSFRSRERSPPRESTGRESAPGP